ncbi:LOW QUALITY PROTEIN: olfactory receptor 56-like [Tupaia chinensis]|uniref:LOW QUALITY PROTEIN: olfactory receptor 56-like n=1 Tax=Tupaia chinensis TaxID=246437 RepID=UPI000FFB22F4|nr:LOW QUALITY PROTEIN: olfactory receptor 56-like [Tupaia chinensis]
MAGGNKSSVTELILLGLFPEFRHATVLNSVIILVYILAFLGNVLLIVLIWGDPRLHTPMYILLSQLSLIDLTLTSTIVPKMATAFFTGDRTISWIGCGTQSFFFLTLGMSECLILTLMAYDRYLAVCSPLRYSAIMSPRSCLRMAAGCWAGGSVSSFIHTVYPMHFPVCGSRQIQHFFCEVPVLIKLSCEDTSVYQLVVVVTSAVARPALLLVLPFGLVTASYTLVFLAVLRMRSGKGRKKVLATCCSHLAVVSLFFGPNIFIYMTFTSSHSAEQDQALSVFSNILTPTLNPLIYSLRNKEVLAALRKLARRHAGPSGGRG